MKPRPFLLLAALGAFWAGCGSVAVQPLARLDPERAAPYALGGKGSVSGQALPGGETSRAAGQKVYLLPDTPHFEDWLHRSVYGANGPELDPQDSRYVRSVVADQDGSFSFAGVPDGKYVLLTVVRWEEPDPNGYMKQEGGPYSEPVEIAGGAPVRVDLQ